MSEINPRTAYYRYIYEIAFELVFDRPKLYKHIDSDALFSTNHRLELLLKTFITAATSAYETREEVENNRDCYVGRLMHLHPVTNYQADAPHIAKATMKLINELRENAPQKPLGF